MTLDMTVKFAEGSDTIIEGLGVPFGLDLDGQQFSAKSDLCLDWFPNGGRPILYHHGFDSAVKMAPIGHEIESTMTDEGLWVRAELDKHSKYYKRVKQLVEKDALGWSSGAPDHKVKVAKSGHIDLWPSVEFSLTPTPAKPNQVAFAMKSAQVEELIESSEDSPLRGITAWGQKVALELAEGIEQTPETPASEPYADETERVLAGFKAWVERTEARVDFRAKSGRELSRANLEAIREAYHKLGALLEKADKPSQDEAEAAKSYAEFLVLEAKQLGMTD